MKSSSRFFLIAVSVAMWVAVVTIPALADTYHTATFTGNINPGSANVKAPFNSVLTQGGPISGSFVIDDNLIPLPGSGFVNVFFSSFPDIALIPAAKAFTIDLGVPALTFTLADAIQNSGAIQFNNGQIRGFFSLQISSSPTTNHIVSTIFFVKDIQPNDQGMDKLLREFLQICAVSNLAASEHNISQMGNEEIEKGERPSNECGLGVGKNCPKAARVISALAVGHKTDGWIIGAG